MYKAREHDEILGELQEWSKADVSKIEGTFENDVFATNAIEFAKVEIELEESYKQRFLHTATGDYLTMIAESSGVVRKTAAKAIGTVVVSGNGELPKGSQFATALGTLFETTKRATIQGSATVPVQAMTAGTIGNVAADTITVIPMNIPGITSVTNPAETYDGFDEESDEELRERALIHVRTPGTSGNKFHYYEWAMSIVGVGSARVLSAEEVGERNHVKVIITDSNFSVASDDLTKKVKDYIETVRPPGALVEVVSAKPKPIDVTATISGSFNVEIFKNKLKAYFIQFSKINTGTVRKISPAKVGSFLFDAGADDYSELSVNGGLETIVLEADEIAVLGTVNIT